MRPPTKLTPLRRTAGYLSASERQDTCKRCRHSVAVPYERTRLQCQLLRRLVGSYGWCREHML